MGDILTTEEEVCFFKLKYVNIEILSNDKLKQTFIPTLPKEK